MRYDDEHTKKVLHVLLNGLIGVIFLTTLDEMMFKFILK